MAITSVHVVEIGMALPDVVFLRVRDQEIVKGSILELASPDSAAMDATVQRDPVTGGAGTSYCRVMGQKNGVQKMYLRFGGTMPTAFLDRDVVDDAANWATIGGRTVTNVYRKTRPFDQEECLPGGTTVKATTMEHLLYVELDGDLPQGGYTISVAGNPFPATQFFFNDKETRAIGLRGSMIGFRPDETRKIADFMLWIPGRGTEGRVDIIGDYGIEDFDIIDVNGDVVYSGTLTEVIDATTAETGVTNLDYASTTTAPKIATGVTQENPCQITCVGHGFVTGQKKFLRGFANSSGTILSQIDSIVHTITVTGTDTFTIPINTTAMNAWSAGEFLTTPIGEQTSESAGYDSRIYDVTTANRFNTWVHRADFSSVTTPGHYRVRIPALGVSDPFLIDDSVRFVDAKIHMKGYYNQLSGVALSEDIGGFERPVDFVDGTNGVQILKSKCPAFFSQETGTSATNSVYDATNAEPGRAPWITTDRISWGISIRDAGDWDYHAWRHCILAYWLVEFGYRWLPAASRDVHLGFPKASTLLGATYSGLDGVGDQIHMALAQLDVWRTTQQIDGRVYGGLQFDNGGSFGGGGSNVYEPSWCTTDSVYVLEADPASNLQYALAAAKMAHVLGELGFTSLKNTWQASAVAAYDWAENLYQDYVAHQADADLSAATELQAFFNTTCGYQTSQSLSDAQFKSAMALLFNSTYVAMRYATVGALYSLTDSTAYGDIIAATNRGLSHQDTWQSVAAWEFVQAPSAVNYTTPSSHVDYYNSRWTVSMTSIRPWPEIVRAFFKTTQNASNTYLQYLLDYVSADSGRNQAGISMTSGIGTRYPHNILNRDREAMGVAGFTANQGAPVYNNRDKQINGGTSVFNFSSDSPLNWTVETPIGSFESTSGTKRLITPLRHCTPINESFVDNSYAIYMTEFTTQEKVVPRLIWALIQHCYDENEEQVPVLNRIRLKLKA